MDQRRVLHYYRRDPSAVWSELSDTEREFLMRYPQGREKVDENLIYLQNVTFTTLDKALDVMTKSFFGHEPVSVGVDLVSEDGACEELIELCRNAVKDGVSLVAIQATTKEVIGVIFNKIQVPTSNGEKSYFQQVSDNCRYKSSKGLMDFMIDVDSRVDLFKQYNVECIFELMFLAIAPEYRKKGIAKMLVDDALELARRMNMGVVGRQGITINGVKQEITNPDAIPTLVSAIMTSAYSQRIATKLNFERVLEVPYDEFEFAGKKYSERISQEHSGCVLVIKRIEQVHEDAEKEIQRKEDEFAKILGLDDTDEEEEDEEETEKEIETEG